MLWVFQGAFGIWCLWNPARINITVLATNTYCIHLGVDYNTPKAWVLTIVYASPQLHLRPRLWECLENFSGTNTLPWCLVGDFNTTLHEYEKEGRAPFNYCSSQQFAECIEEYNLIDLGFKGPPFTWVRESLRQRIDRALCNTAWLTLFPTSQVIHLPIPSSDHCAIWLQDKQGQNPRGDRNYFKFLCPWLDHPGFKDQVQLAWQSSFSWVDNISRLTLSLKDWNRDVFGNIFRRKQRILSRLEGINKVLLEHENVRLEALREILWGDYALVVQQEEAYWYQQAKSKWVQMGDKNTRFFHQATVTRRRYNRITALRNSDNVGFMLTKIFLIWLWNSIKGSIPLLHLWVLCSLAV